MSRNKRLYYAENISKNTSGKIRERLEIDPYRGGLSEQDLRQLRRSLAKVANQRLVRLERSQSAVTGESYADYGAAELVRDYLGERKRYSESLGYGDIAQVRRDIYSLQTFIASKSSTVAGQKELEQKRIETFSSGQWGATGHGARIAAASNKSFYDFLSSSTFKEMSKLFSSEQLVELYEQQYEKGKNHESVMRQFDKAFEQFQSQQVEASEKNLATIVGRSRRLTGK